MIKIRRSNTPIPLQKADNLFRQNDYKKPEVKTALLTMQHFKCCYCERDLTIVSDTEREVDHYFPRDYFKNNNGQIQWHLANAWLNLLLSCRKCNSDKSTNTPRDVTIGEIYIINPSDDNMDPEDHIEFIVDESKKYITYTTRNNSPQGKSTIELLKLGEREDLFATLRLLKCDIDKMFSELVNSTIFEQNQKLSDLTDDLKKLMSAHSCFASFSRKYIEQCRDDFNDKIVPHLEKTHNKTFAPLNINILRGYETFP